MHIDDKSKVPLFAVLSCGAFVIGAIITVTMWLTSVDAKATEAKVSMLELKPMMIDILVRIIRIEERLKK